jgi:hypothetical protein
VLEPLIRQAYANAAVAAAEKEVDA